MPAIVIDLLNTHHPVNSARRLFVCNRFTVWSLSPEFAFTTWGTSHHQLFGGDLLLETARR